MSIIIIDGAKKKKYKNLDLFLEKVYERQRFEEAFTKERTERKRRHIDEILSNINIPAEQKERFINLSKVEVKPVPQDAVKYLRILSSHSDSVKIAREEIQKIPIHRLGIKIPNKKIKELILGKHDITK